MSTRHCFFQIYFLVYPSQLKCFQNTFHLTHLFGPSGSRNFPKMSTVLIYLEPESCTVCQRSIVYNLNRFFDIISTLEYQTKPKLSIQCAHQGSHHCIHCTSCTQKRIQKESPCYCTIQSWGRALHISVSWVIDFLHWGVNISFFLIELFNFIQTRKCENRNKEISYRTRHQT